MKEVIIFLTSKNYNTQYLQFLINPKWIQNFCVLVDITKNFNTLNLKLQGKGNTALQLEEVIIFKQQLRVFLEGITKDDFVFFENYVIIF